MKERKSIPRHCIQDIEAGANRSKIGRAVLHRRERNAGRDFYYQGKSKKYQRWYSSQILKKRVTLVRAQSCKPDIFDIFLSKQFYCGSVNNLRNLGKHRVSMKVIYSFHPGLRWVVNFRKVM